MQYVKRYTVALLGLGLLNVFFALQLLFLTRSLESPVFLYISSFLLLQGAFCLAVAAGRWSGSAAALPATWAVSFWLLLFFPLGTALSIYWLERVKGKEGRPEGGAERSGFYYTVSLCVFGLAVLSTLPALWFILRPSSAAIQALRVGIPIVGAVAILLALWRSTLSRAAHFATLAFNLLLLLWPPFGTAIALFWFFRVLRQERTILATGNPDDP